MMENYEDIRLEHVKTKEICGVDELSIASGTSFLNYDGQTQNLNFGAEILSTKPKPTERTTIMATEPEEEEEDESDDEDDNDYEEATSEQQWKAAATNDEIKTKILLSTGNDAKELQHATNNKDNVTYVNGTENNSQEQQEQQRQQSGSSEQLDSSSNIDDDDDDDDDESSGSSSNSSDTDDCSDASASSDASARAWKPPTPYHVKWVQKQMHSGRDPRDLLSMVLPNGTPDLGPGTNDMMLWRMLSSMLSAFGAEYEQKRRKLRNINTFEDVLRLVQQSRKIIVLSGAGVSVSCGIPDFRSSNGIYSRLARDFPDLPDPQAMFDINYFSRDPRPFFKFAREIYPGQFEPSPGHRFIKMLETKGKLLRNYTQNIDTLEQVAGIRRVIECHGSFSTASCTKCKFKCNADDIRADIFAQRIPVCPQCQPKKEHSIEASFAVTEYELRKLVENGIMKPDIVFFGEGLPDEFHNVMATDKDECDLLIVMGSSLKVRPVNCIPNSIPVSVPQILINREKLHHLEFDVELLGDSDVIINQLCHRLGTDWHDICFDDNVLTETKELPPLKNDIQLQLQQQDTDTQSIKSNASTEYLFSSAGTCSDSGFESSTFSSVNIKRNTTKDTANEAIEKIKCNILDELNETTNEQKQQQPNTLQHETQDILELLNGAGSEAMETAINYENITINALNEMPNRHFSIDSSKDSGIEQCETNYLTLNNADVPRLNNFGDSGGTTATTTTADVPNHITQTNTTISAGFIQKDSASVAERLPAGTYYCIGNNRSYVFPGAQVFLDKDFEDDNDTDDDGAREASTNSRQHCVEREDMYIDEEDDETSQSPPLSPLMTASVEARIVHELSANRRTVVPKRRTSETGEARVSGTSNTTVNNANAADELAAACQHATNDISGSSANNSICDDNSTNDDVTCTPPPLKKRRSSLDNYLPPPPLINEDDGPTAAAATQIT